MNNEFILEIKNLELSYGSVAALKGVSLQVAPGKIVALLGANGAGKSSLLQAISGLVPSQAGSITFERQDITRTTAEKIVSLGISHSPEGRQIFPDLTTENNLMIGAFTQRSKGEIKKNLRTAYDMFPILEQRRRQIAGTLSGGEQQMLAIARALMPSPKLLILDEPSLGLAPLIVRDIFRMIHRINQTGTSVLIVEQNAAQTLKIADYAYVLEVGMVSMEGPAQELLSNDDLIKAYLGGH